MISNKLFSSEDQTWATPRPFFEKLNTIFSFKLDPCCAHETAKCEVYFTKKEDGLKQNWAAVGNAFVNPPFGRELPKWMQKCSDEATKDITVVMLIPARVDTSYWHDIAFKNASCICFVRGRIKFELYGTNTHKNNWALAPFPNAIIVFGNCTADQRLQLKQFGKVFEIQRQIEAETSGVEILRTPPTTSFSGIGAGDSL